MISSKYATGHIGVDLGLNFVTHKYVWGVTFEKRDTAEVSRKFRVLLINADFLEHVDQINVDLLVGAGQDGYSSYRRDRFSKLLTLRELWKNMSEAKGKALFLVGELEIAVPSPGGGGRSGIDWPKHYKKEPALPNDLDNAIVQSSRDANQSGCGEDRSGCDRLTPTPVHDSAVPSSISGQGNADKEAGSSRKHHELAQGRVLRRPRQGTSRQPAKDNTFEVSRASAGIVTGTGKTPVMQEREAMPQLSLAPATAASPRSPRSPQDRYEAYLGLLREGTQAKRRSGGNRSPL